MKKTIPLLLSTVMIFVTSILLCSTLSCSDTMEDTVFNKHLEPGVFGTSQWDNSRFE